MAMASLHSRFVDASSRHGTRTAVVEPGHGEISYAALAALSDRLRDRLHAIGVRPGDRVGIYLRKSIDAVATILGILKCGAAYVPVDPGAPAERNAYIMDNCSVRAVVIEDRFVEKFTAHASDAAVATARVVLDDVGGGTALDQALARMQRDKPAPACVTSDSKPGDLAYILYTSGSTGKPKGVMLSHENAASFVDWCSEVFAPVPDDRFSSHAPFHFDLSILDVHVSLKHGATLVLIPEQSSKDPQHLAQLIEDERITIWYSAPSILGLLAQFGNLERRAFPALRLILFAGEVFAVKHLRSLSRMLPHPRYFNLYGPTETNVCTFYEVPMPVPDERTVPYPIGKVCSHLEGKVVGDLDAVVRQGDEGELCIAGRGVMQGYWALPEQTSRGFLADTGGKRWYRTGDVVVEAPDGNLTYLGRRDRMVKRRGYRVELGEIEAALYRHAKVGEAAVIATPDEEAGVKIVAFLTCKDAQTPSLVEMKRFCAECLPLYMIPDRFSWQPQLPKTSTDKVDYQRLKAMS
jgi:amino acid adenylation domain-containing protein